MMKEYLTGNIEWIYPCQEQPPKNVKLSLLTTGGMQTVGFWADDGRYIAWFPLLRRNKDLEIRLGYRGSPQDSKIAESVARLGTMVTV